MSYILSKTCQNCPTLAQTGSWEAGQALIHMCCGGCVLRGSGAAAMCQTCSLFCGVPFILLACFVFTSCWPTLRSSSNPPGSFHGWLGWSTLLCLWLIRISDSRRRSLQKKKKKWEREKKQENHQGLSGSGAQGHYVLCLKGLGLNSFTRALACNHEDYSDSMHCAFE